MNHQPLSSRSGVLILLLFCIAFISYPIQAQPDSASFEKTGEIFSGSIPSGDGIVSIKAASGKLYQIPAMSPLGVVQALAGTDSIDSYQIGDELIVKKGILILDGINNLTYSGDNCWFVQVNNRQLQDYYLPTKDALNTYPLSNGDVILYAYGNPTRPLSEAVATMTVTIGSQNNQGVPVTPVATIPVTPVSSPVLTSVPTPVVTPPALPSPTPIPIPTETQPVITPEPTQQSGPEKDPNQPVFEGKDLQSSQQSSTSDTEKDPNQPVFEDEDDDVEEETLTTEPEEEKEPEDQDEEEREDVTPERTSTSGSSGQDVLYDNSLSVPSGTINITADSGMDYDIPSNTPLGLLQLLYNNGNINSLSVSDKGMNKGGILTIMGINEYQFGDNGWFAQINDNTLKDWASPGSDGLNIRTFGSGDRVTFYYGTMDQYPSSAKAVIYVDID